MGKCRDVTKRKKKATKSIPKINSRKEKVIINKKKRRRGGLHRAEDPGLCDKQNADRPGPLGIWYYHALDGSFNSVQ